MSINHLVLGGPGRDNALLVTVDSGQAVDRLLFDCGGGCLDALGFAEIQAVDHLFFSHLHMDHVGGFDQWFRCNYTREARPNRIWGPAGTARILQHRFQGYLWNLVDDQRATWLVTDVDDAELRTWRYELDEAFATAHECGREPRGATVVEGAGCTVEALRLEHQGPCLAWRVTEKPRRNIDLARLAGLGLAPGPWLKAVKDGAEGQVQAGGRTVDAAELREKLLVETAGESVAYLTDFLLDDAAMERLTGFVAGCGTVVCEAQYRHEDLALAQRNFHTTTVQVATLASRAAVGRLVLFHLSVRYDQAAWRDMLAEAQAVFPATEFPPHWDLAADAAPAAGAEAP